jgi:hypothetical protein
VFQKAITGSCDTVLDCFTRGSPKETASIHQPIIRADVLDGSTACVRLHFRLRWMLAGQNGVEQLPNEPQCIHLVVMLAGRKAKKLCPESRNPRRA